MAEMPYSGLVVEPCRGSRGSVLPRRFRTAVVLLATASALPQQAKDLRNSGICFVAG